MFVRDWMSTPAVVISDDVRLKAALQIMESRSIRRFPVLRAGKLVGVVTRSDMAPVIGTGGITRRGENHTVADVMTSKPVAIEPGDTLESAAQIMLNRKISGLPVVENARVVGILTESDLFRALCRMLGIGERGARVVLSVEDGQDLLRVVQKRLDGLVMKSLVTVHDPKRKNWHVVLRVRGRSSARRKATQAII